MMLLKIWDISHKNPYVGVSFSKVADQKACNFIKKDSNTGASCEIFENFKNTNFEEHLRETASVLLRKISPLLVSWKPMLDGKWNNWAINTFYWKYERVWTSWS